jgi:peptidyl-dipeptidase A
MDAGALLEYFGPLQDWLKQQNEGQTCGWSVPSATPTAAKQATPAPSHA